MRILTCLIKQEQLSIHSDLQKRFAFKYFKKNKPMGMMIAYSAQSFNQQLSTWPSTLLKIHITVTIFKIQTFLFITLNYFLLEENHFAACISKY